MLKVLATVVVGLVLNLPSTTLGQVIKPPVDPGETIELRIGGAVRNGGLFRSGDRLFVGWASAIPEQSRTSRNVGLVGLFVAATAAIVAFGIN